MPLHETKTPTTNDGRVEPASYNAQSVTGHSAGDKGRSVGHPTWYRVGCAGDCAVYWHPVVGVAMEVDSRHLVDYAGPVKYFGNPHDFRRLYTDVAINPGLIEAMPEELHLAYIALEMVVQVRFAEDWADTQVKDEMRAHVARTEVF
jgi:hypothetical protein